MIRAAHRLELSVCRVGRVPGAHTVHEAYKWVDARGRPVSPPPDLLGARHVAEEEADTRSRSSLNLLKGSDERKVGGGEGRRGGRGGGGGGGEGGEERRGGGRGGGLS